MEKPVLKRGPVCHDCLAVHAGCQNLKIDNKSMSILVHSGSTCRPWMIWRMDDGGDDDDDDDHDDDDDDSDDDHG